MLEKEDLETIQKMIDASEERIIQRTVALMDLEFRPQFNLLADSINTIMDKLGIEPRVARLEEDMSAVKAAVHTNRQDIDKLKEAI